MDEMKEFVDKIMATARPLTDKQIQRLRSLLTTARSEREIRDRSDHAAH